MNGERAGSDGEGRAPGPNPGEETRASGSATTSPRTDLISGGTLSCPPDNGNSGGQQRGHRGASNYARRHGFEIALFVLALVYGFGARGLTSSGDPGVALVPIGLAAALALLSAGIALSGWRKQRRGRGPDMVDDSNSSGAAAPNPPGPAGGSAGHPDRGADPEVGGGDDGAECIRRSSSTRAWSVAGLTILYAALFQPLGYVLATLLYTAAVAERFGARCRTILVLTPCVTLLIFVLFRVILGARLPGGLLG